MYMPEGYSSGHKSVYLPTLCDRHSAGTQSADISQLIYVPEMYVWHTRTAHTHSGTCWTGTCWHKHTLWEQIGLSSCGCSRSLRWACDAAVVTSWVGCAKGVGAYSQRPVLVCVFYVYRRKGSEWRQSWGWGRWSEKWKGWERHSWTAVGSLTPQLCSTDLPVIRLYNLISLFYFTAAKHQYVCLSSRSLHLYLKSLKDIRFADMICLMAPGKLHQAWLCGLGCESLSQTGSSWFPGRLWRSLPAWKRVPGRGLYSCLLACPDLVRRKRHLQPFMAKTCLGELYQEQTKLCVWVCVCVVVKTHYVRMREESWHRGSFLYPKIN